MWPEVRSCNFVKVQAARDEMQWGKEGPPPLLVKIAPDLSKEDLEDIAAVCICARFKIAPLFPNMMFS